MVPHSIALITFFVVLVLLLRRVCDKEVDVSVLHRKTRRRIHGEVR